MTRRSYEEVERDLFQPLDASRVKHRDAGRGRQVPYIEGYDAISRANEIFGFDGWAYRVEDVRLGEPGSFYQAVVTVEALGVKRTDVGVAGLAGGGSPEAHDMALKGAVTDALKRGLRSFGAQFGNELYMKEDEAVPQPPRQRERLGTKSEPKARTVGDFLSWAFKEHGLRREQVFALLGVAAAEEISDLKVATARVRAATEKQGENSASS